MIKLNEQFQTKSTTIMKNYKENMKRGKHYDYSRRSK